MNEVSLQEKNKICYRKLAINWIGS